MNLEKFNNLKNDIQKTNETTSNRVVSLSIEEIIPNPKNFYKMSDIDDLKESIEESGLISPLIVRLEKETEKYVLLSGHRRFEALKRLWSEEEESEKLENSYENVDCIVLDIENELEEELLIINANMHRKMSKEELDEELIKRKETYKNMKELGIFTGNINQKLAEDFGISETSVKNKTKKEKKEKTHEEKVEFELRKIEKAIDKVLELGVAPDMEDVFFKLQSIVERELR